MTVIDFYNALCELYPSSLSSSWDNDGLMCCPDKDRPVRRVLVSLDATDEALSYAKDNGFDLVLTHHPLIFKGLRSLNQFDVVGRRVLSAVCSGISVISLHTRLDAGKNGVNDILAEKLGLTDITCFGDEDNPSLGRIGTVSPCSTESFAQRIKSALSVPSVCAYVQGPVNRVAVVGGGGGDLISDAKKNGADTLVTGESGYNKSLDAKELGINVFLAGHYFTEMPVCERLSVLAKDIAGAETEIFKTAPEIYF